MYSPPDNDPNDVFATGIRQSVDTLRNLHWGHWLFAVISVLITVGATLSVRSAEIARAERRFDREMDRTVNLLADHLQRYEDVLRTRVAKIAAAEGRLARDEWEIITRRMADSLEYPAVTGSVVGFAVPAGALDAFIAEQRRYRPDFTVWPEGRADVHLPLTYVQTGETQGRLEGMDASQDPKRKATILAAAALNSARMAEPMVTDSSGMLDFVLLVPFYKRGEVPPASERQAAFAGWVGLSIRVSHLVEGVLAHRQSDLLMQLRDGDTMLYDEPAIAIDSADANPLQTGVIDMPVHGRTWRLEFQTTLDFRDEFASGVTLIVLAIGLLIDVMAFTLLLMLSRTKARAEETARLVTRSLDQTGEELERANQELEGFAHVVAYDLQMPLRDIGMLSDRLGVDLAKPLDDTTRREIRSNLVRVGHTTDRASSLITGVLDYHHIGALDDLRDSGDLDELLERIVARLGLDATRLRLTGNVRKVETHPACLEEVLRHVIDNAFTHHPDPGRARVTVSADELDRFIRISVADNGIGIASIHHERIFELLHTLRSQARADGVGVGVGVGLSIARKIVVLFGGELSVRSSLGNGATFIIDWPKALQAANDDSLETSEGKAA